MGLEVPTWVLVAFMLSSSNSSAMTTIPGFTTQQACYEAADNYEEEPFIKDRGNNIRRSAVCIKGPNK